MRVSMFLGLLLSCSMATLAQAPASSSISAPSPDTTQTMGSYSMTPVLADLDRLQAASSATDAAIARLRIEKWKADGNSRQQAESNAESIQRNLRSALPGIIANVRSAPQDVGAEFKLYRNLNALYDVMSSLTESAGAFGPKSDYEALARQLDAVDSIRRTVGDSLEQLTASTQSQLDQLRTQVKTLEAKANIEPPKKTVVDDTEPAKKSSSAQKKKTKKPATSTGGTAGNSAGSPSTPPQ
jgi:BMFP domain-containing protein YqiC